MSNIENVKRVVWIHQRPYMPAKCWLGFETCHVPNRRLVMQRKKASDFDQRLLDLYDGYVSGMVDELLTRLGDRAHDRELWKTDGTGPGTQRLDIVLQFNRSVLV